MPPTRGVQERALAAAIAARPTKPEDAAIEALARRYAQLIDQERGEESEAAVLVKLGQRYEAALAALGLTPAARATQTPKGGATVHELPANPLQAARDAARQRRAASGDAPAS